MEEWKYGRMEVWKNGSSLFASSQRSTVIGQRKKDH